jgi:serine/threonine protein kinase
LFLILEYCPGGDLAEYIELEKKFDENKTRMYAAEILLALEEVFNLNMLTNIISCIGRT